MSDSASHGSTLGRAAVACLCLVVVVARVLGLACYPIYDDAFITYRYSQNLADGLGMVYNPGAAWEPILGTTTPAYAGLLGGLVALGLPVRGASLGLNFLVDAVSAGCLAALFSRRALATCVTLALFACLPWMTRVSIGGMESPLLLCLCLLAALAAERGRFAWAGLASALAVWVRPEAVLLVMLLFVLSIRSLRQAVRFLLPVAVVAVLGLWLLTSIYDTPIPQSVRAKAPSPTLGSRIKRAQEVFEQAWYPGRWTALFLPIVVVGVWRMLRGPGGSSARSGLGLRCLAGFGLLMLAAYLASGAKTWGWYFYTPLAVWICGFGLGVEALTKRYTVFSKSQPTTWAVGSACASLIAATLLARAFPDRITPSVYQSMQAFAEQQSPSERQAQVLASDIGAIGFFTGMRVLDSEGLVWPEAKLAKGQVDLIRTHRPRYVMLVVHNPWIGNFLSDPISTDYTPIRRWNKHGDKDLWPSPDSLGELWVQDYLLYERKDLSGT